MYTHTHTRARFRSWSRFFFFFLSLALFRQFALLLRACENFVCSSFLLFFALIMCSFLLFKYNINKRLVFIFIKKKQNNIVRHTLEATTTKQFSNICICDAKRRIVLLLFYFSQRLLAVYFSRTKRNELIFRDSTRIDPKLRPTNAILKDFEREQNKKDIRIIKIVLSLQITSF